MSDETETETTQPNPHLDHITAAPCDDCSQEMKRLAMFSAIAGAAIGICAAMALVKARG